MTNAETGHRRFSEVVSTNPEPLSTERRMTLNREIHERKRELANHNIGARETTIAIYNDEVSILVPLGDTHIGSDATDMYALDDRIDFIMTHDNAYAVLTGDFIEYIAQKYFGTNVAHLSMSANDMIFYAKETLRPMADLGKVVMDITDYFGHEGWEDIIDVWRLLTDEFKIPHIRNGGILDLSYPNGETQSIKTHHYPKKKSGYNPLYGLTEELIRFSAEVRPDGAIGGHTHQSATAQINWPRAVKTFFVLNTGTDKGSNPDGAPDSFGPRISADYADPLGQAIVTKPGTPDSPKFNYPVNTLQQGQNLLESIQILRRAPRNTTLLRAMDISESAAHQNITDELIETVRARVENKPQIRFLKSVSEKLTHSPYADQFHKTASQEEVPTKYPEVFTTVKVEVVSQLPLILHPFSNTRMGSNSEGTRPLKQYLDELIAENPHALYLLMRNMYDPDIYRRSNRQSILDKGIKLFEPTQQQLLGILADSGLLHDGWKRSVGTEYNQQPVAPVNYASAKLNTPVLPGESLLEIAIRQPGSRDKITYSSLLLDGLRGQNRQTHPLAGLINYYHSWGGIKPGTIIGGNNEASGVGQIHDRHNTETQYPAFIAPGWFSYATNTRSKKSIGTGAQPGQAEIMLPDKYMVYLTANINQTRDVYNALLLKYGLDILGYSDKVLENS